MTADVDIVHSRSPENVARLTQVLRDLDAYVRSDLAGRRLFPLEGHLTGHGHINLMTRLGPLDVLCEVGDNLSYGFTCWQWRCSGLGACSMQEPLKPRFGRSGHAGLRARRRPGPGFRATPTKIPSPLWPVK